ncbi:hypothetical protein OBBRIDRAFT_808915, partial [Obba rivulosa]
MYHGGQPRGPLPLSTSAPTLSSAPTRTALAPLPPYHEYPRHATDNGRPPDMAQRNGSPGITGTPGILGQQSYGGLYAGPTSVASHFITASECDESDGTDHAHTPTDAPSPSAGSSTTLSTSTGATCTSTSPCSLSRGRGSRASSRASDRVVLATVCILIALPPAGPRRHREDTDRLAGTHTLELVELVLVRRHYLTFAKEDPEGAAPRSGQEPLRPGGGRALRAFMFGRPLSIASHHFNTQLPSYCDPALDKSGRLYLPNIALFRLAYILGDIMDYPDKDKLLAQWHEALPMELDLDEYRIACSLASPITS